MRAGQVDWRGLSAIQLWRQSWSAPGLVVSSSTLGGLRLLNKLLARIRCTMKLATPRLHSVLYRGDRRCVRLCTEPGELALHLLGGVLGGAHGSDGLIDLVNSVLKLLDQFVE
jgi:hypothetical protein